MLSRCKAVVVLLLYCLCLRATKAQVLDFDPELRFINAPTSITAGEEFQLTFANDDDGTFDDNARIVLSRGVLGSLRTVEVLVEVVTAGQFTWNVNPDLPGGADYFLQLQQDDDFGLYGPFSIEPAAAPTPSPGPEPEPEPNPVPAPAPEPSTSAGSETSAESTPEPTSDASEPSGSATANSDGASAATTGVTTSETSGAESTAARPGAESATALADEINETASASPDAESGGGGGGLSTGASAGVGVGVSAGALALIAGAFVIWRRNRKQPPQTTADEKAGFASSSYEPDIKKSYASGGPAEMETGQDSQMGPVELDAYTEPQEMSAPGYVPYRPGARPDM